MRLPRPTNPADSARDQANSLIQQGHSFEDQGRPGAALSCYHKAVALESSYPCAHLNLGNAYLALNEIELAISCYHTAVRLQPDYSHAYFNLGRALLQVKKHEDSIAALETALKHKPDFAEAQLTLGCAYEELGKEHQALQHYQASLAINPSYAWAHINLGALHYRGGRMGDALAEFRLAEQENPILAMAHSWLAKILREMGYSTEALDHIRRAHDLSPNHAAYHSALLFGLNCAAGIPTDELFTEHVAFAQRHCAYIKQKTNHSNQPDPERRLRIGYVSGDFIGHPVALFLEPLLQSHARDQVEVFCYHNNPETDVVTTRLKGKSDQWRDIAHLDDVATANLIQRDQIDILVDLSGHTNLNRLLLFAHKPAPVQATWLGYLGTTGLSVMDYRICDTYTDPVGLTEAQHTERLARLPNSQWCYAPLVHLPPVTGLPMSANGYLTLGSFNNLSKLNGEVISLWARVLQALPDARLLIAAVPDQESSDHLTTQFAYYGIAQGRLTFRSRQIPAEYFASYNEIDIVLDPFPYNGGTTSLDALLMGVPIVALAGERSISRGGVSILSNLGLGEFIATTPEDYIRIVRDLASTPARLARLRSTLRSRMKLSPLMDVQRFTHDIEQLYRQMWRQWLETRP